MRVSCEKVGAIDAFLKLRATTAHRVSLVALYAMHAALLDRDWRNLSEEERAALGHAVG
jgi:hypothetical protein